MEMKSRKSTSGIVQTSCSSSAFRFSPRILPVRSSFPAYSAGKMSRSQSRGFEHP